MIYLTKENIETLNIKEAFPGGLEIVNKGFFIYLHVFLYIGH